MHQDGRVLLIEFIQTLSSQFKAKKSCSKKRLRIIKSIVVLISITMWKLRKFTHTIFPQKFREINAFIQYTKLHWSMLFSRIFSGESKFRNFSHCATTIDRKRHQHHVHFLLSHLQMPLDSNIFRWVCALLRHSSTVFE